MEKKADALIKRLIANAKKIQKARYGDLDELYNLTKAGVYPKNIVELAEAFGMMAVKLEAREYKLEQTINELRETSENLRISNDKLEDYSRSLEKKVEERTAEIMKMASTDDLTQLYNRKEILKKLRYELSRRRSPSLSIIFFDIDHFKEFNDRFGHQVGDQVLKRVADTVRDCIREYDMPGRFGGEEFIIVLPDTSGKDASVVARRIQKGLRSNPLRHKGKKLGITASFGVVSVMDNEKYLCSALGIGSLEPGHEMDKESFKDHLCELLIKYSDDAMYRAKKSSCLDCGTASEKKEYFSGGVCPLCSSRNIEEGRNRTMIFQDGKILAVSAEAGTLEN